jgi:hypothetical protein
VLQGEVGTCIDGRRAADAADIDGQLPRRPEVARLGRPGSMSLVRGSRRARNGGERRRSGIPEGEGRRREEGRGGGRGGR